MSEIEKRLREYKSDLSKLHLIECEMKRIESEIQVLEPSYISAISYSLTPKSITNKFNSIVENAVIDMEKNEEKVKQLKKQLRLMVADRERILLRTEEVEALLEALTSEERFVIERYYFDGLPWHMVAEKYRKEYGIYKTAKTMKSKRFEALKKMERNLLMYKEKSPV